MAKNRDPYFSDNERQSLVLNYATWLRFADREKHPEITFGRDAEMSALNYAEAGVEALLENKDPDLRALKRDLRFEASGSAGVAVPSDLIKAMHYEVFDEADKLLEPSQDGRGKGGKKGLLSVEEAANRGVKPTGRFMS